MNKSKFLMMLGLCRKAGCMIMGTPMVTKFLPKAQIITVFYSSDASDNTKKKIKDKCSFYGTPCIETDILSEELAHAVGKTGALSAVGITDRNFANELSNLISNEKR